MAMEKQKLGPQRVPMREAERDWLPYALRKAGVRFEVAGEYRDMLLISREEGNWELAVRAFNQNPVRVLADMEREEREEAMADLRAHQRAMALERTAWRLKAEAAAHRRAAWRGLWRHLRAWGLIVTSPVWVLLALIARAGRRRR